MKKISAIALLALGSLVSVGSASAQDHAIRATVPFDFAVGSKVLPAGAYTIEPTSADSVLIWNSEKHISVISRAYAGDKESITSKLVFNKYGDQYFLREILASSINVNLEPPTSKLEKRVRSSPVARLNGGEQVLVALE